MIAPARQLPIESTGIDAPVSAEVIELVAGLLLDVVESQDHQEIADAGRGQGGLVQ